MGPTKEQCKKCKNKDCKCKLCRGEHIFVHMNCDCGWDEDDKCFHHYNDEVFIT